MLSKEKAEKTIQALALSLKSPWMLVAHNITNGMSTSDVECLLTANGALNTRLISVCTPMRCDGMLYMCNYNVILVCGKLSIGDVDLATSSDVVMGWWGEMQHPLIQEQSINTIVCHPEEENTMISSRPTGWMLYLLKNCTAAADIFSVSG